MTALVVIGGWGLPVEVLEPLTAGWQGRRYQFGVDQPLSTANLAPEAFVDELLAQVPEDAVWFGWSLGGQLAMLAAARATRPPRGVISLCSAPSFVSRADWPQGMPLAQFEAFTQGMRDNTARQWGRFLLLQSRGDADESGARRALSPWLDRGCPSATSTLLSTLGWLETLDLRPLWWAPPCPALHILGACDPLVDVAVAAAAGPQSRVSRVTGMAHWPQARYHKTIWQMIQRSLAEWV